MRTPWGYADFKEIIAAGILQVSTPSHGGIHLSPERNAQVHPVWRDEKGWYEEDCEWAIPALTFPDEFEEHWDRAYDRPGVVVDAARGCAIRWHTDQYRAVYPDTAEADIAAERAARA